MSSLLLVGTSDQLVTSAMGTKASGKRKAAPAAPKQLPAEGATNKRPPRLPSR